MYCRCVNYWLPCLQDGFFLGQEISVESSSFCWPAGRSIDRESNVFHDVEKVAGHALMMRQKEGNLHWCLSIALRQAWLATLKD